LGWKRLPAFEGIKFMAATHPKPPAKNAKDEYAAFENALKKIVSVPRSQIKITKHNRRGASSSREASATG
jgi:hypothetical protein